MPNAKKKTSTAAETRQAIATGRKLANEALARRDKRRGKQVRAVAAAAKIGARVAARAVGRRPTIKRATAAALAARTSSDVLIAEGDSWFDYPFFDILDQLSDRGFDIESVAHYGDMIEDMAYAPGQLDKFIERLERVLAKGIVPRAILLSGGGNDIAGDEFPILLNHALSPIKGLNDDIVTGVIDKRLRLSYVTIISAITATCLKHLTGPLPILTHGYDFPVPDGRGFLGGFLFLPGPWLRPGFHAKGFGDQTANTATIKALITRFNTMVESVSAQFAHVHYVNLRGALSNGADHRKFWDNELHPNNRGFGLITDRFQAVLNKLP